MWRSGLGKKEDGSGGQVAQSVRGKPGSRGAGLSGETPAEHTPTDLGTTLWIPLQTPLTAICSTFLVPLIQDLVGEVILYIFYLKSRG